MQPTGGAMAAQGQDNLPAAVHTQVAMVWCEEQSTGSLQSRCGWKVQSNLKHRTQGAGEIAQWLRALVILLEDSNSVPSPHMVICDHL